MTGQDVVTQLKGHAGQHVPVVWERTLGLLKTAPEGTVVTKRTYMYVRAGINYSNLKTVRERRYRSPKPRPSSPYAAKRAAFRSLRLAAR